MLLLLCFCGGVLCFDNIRHDRGVAMRCRGTENSNANVSGEAGFVSPVEWGFELSND